MIFIEKKMTGEEVDELLQKNRTDRFAITDYAFEYLYEKGYIKSEEEFKGAHIKSNNGEYSLLCITNPKLKNNYST